MTSALSLTSRTWFDSIINLIPVPAFVSAIDPPSYVTLYPLSAATRDRALCRQLIPIARATVVDGSINKESVDQRFQLQLAGLFRMFVVSFDAVNPNGRQAPSRCATAALCQCVSRCVIGLLSS